MQAAAVVVATACMARVEMVVPQLTPVQVQRVALVMGMVLAVAVLAAHKVAAVLRLAAVQVALGLAVTS
jgi:hypothetical protein